MVRKQKFSSPVILAGLGILMILLFLFTAATGYKGTIPGSDLYRNKNDFGFYIFYRLLEELDYPVSLDYSIDLPAGTGHSLVYIDMNENSENDSEVMENWVRRGNDLILIGSRAISIFFDDSDIFDQEKQTVKIENRDYDINFTLKDEFINGLKNTSVISPGSNGKGAVLLESEIGAGTIFLVADRSLFANASMKERKNALLLEYVFQSYNSKKLHLRERNSVSLYDPSLIGTLFSGRLSYLTLHLLAIIICFYSITAKRFSTPQKTDGKTVRRISSHIHAVGLFYRKAGAADLIEQTGADYFRYVICRNRKPSVLNDDEFNDMITARTGNNSDELLKRFHKRENMIKKTGRKPHEPIHRR